MSSCKIYTVYIYMYKTCFSEASWIKESTQSTTSLSSCSMSQIHTTCQKRNSLQKYRRKTFEKLLLHVTVQYFQLVNTFAETFPSFFFSTKISKLSISPPLVHRNKKHSYYGCIHQKERHVVNSTLRP